MTLQPKSRIYLIVGAAVLLVCVGVLFLGLLALLWRGGPRSGSPNANLLLTLAAATPDSAPAQPPQPAQAPDKAEPSGKIVFTCQLFKVQASNQICIINADGTGFRRITTDSSRQHRYASLSPNGASVVYAAFLEPDVYEIYEQDLSGGTPRRLTDHLGVLSAPEISPDGTLIVFTRWTAASNRNTLWLIDRDGGDPRQLYAPSSGEAWDPTWSPDGSRILLASDQAGSVQLWSIDVDGNSPRRISDLPAIRGRSDWSSLDQIVTYSGPPWGRELFIMGADGSGQRQASPAGGNSQGPAFSPDGAWIAFTAYFDHFRDDHGCEIYVIRTDGSGLRRLTDNDYCDYQPRWGP